MDISNLKRATDWFRVHSVRKIDDPSGQIDRRELVISLDQYPVDIGLGPNPRRPDPKSRVAKEIHTTLKDNGENFHLLNRGVTILAKNMEYDNKTERVRLHLDGSEEEQSHYGILDGGNTNEQINQWRADLSDETAAEQLQKRFINAQVLVPRVQLTSGVETLLNDIKEARNTSVQVKQKSLADAKHQYDLLKKVLANEKYYEAISWREGEQGSIDVLQIISLLMVFYPPFSEKAPDGEPNGAYGRPEKCLDAFLRISEDQGDHLDQWINFVPDMLRLFDTIQYSFPDLLGGRFGAVKEVRIWDEKKYEKGTKKYRKTPSKSAFFLQNMKYEYPAGWVYPMYAAFRLLLGNTQGALKWKRDPFEFWAQHGGELCSRYEPHLKQDGYETNKIARSAITYSAMREAVTGMYKDDLLTEAGITA